MTDTDYLTKQPKNLKIEPPKNKLRKAARKLGISELEYLKSELGSNAIQLKGNFKTIFRGLEDLGRVSVLTQSKYALYECKGNYKIFFFKRNCQTGFVINTTMSLCLLMEECIYAYAVRTKKNTGEILHALQFFNHKGISIHTIYLTSYSNPIKFNNIIQKYRAKKQTRRTIIKTPTSTKKTKSILNFTPTPIFRREWLKLMKTKDDLPLIQKNELLNIRDLGAPSKINAFEINKQAVIRLFELAIEQRILIRVFIGNSGCLQSHTGLAHHLVKTRNWLNVIGLDFNLHLNMSGVASVWIVKKIIKNRLSTGLKIFDKKGNTIIYCSSKNEPTNVESYNWQTLVKNLEEQFKNI